MEVGKGNILFKIMAKDELTPKQRLHNIRFGKSKRIKPKVIKIDKNSKCEICGVNKPLDTCHIVSMKFLADIEGIDKRFIDYDGFNTIILCSNHHKLFDRFDLDISDFMKIWPKVDEILKETAYNLIGKIGDRIGKNGKITVSSRNQDLIEFIKKFNKYGK